MESIVQHHTQTADGHSFLFPQQQYSSSGDDADSPPSLTNSSESPRSTSEEGGSSSSPRQSLAFGHAKDAHHQAQNAKLSKPSTRTGQVDRVAVEEDDSSSNLNNQAQSPNWDSVFGTGAEQSDMMDFTQPTFPTTAAPQQSQPSGSVLPNAQTFATTADDARLNDDAMFEAMIEYEQQGGNDGEDASKTSMTVDTTTNVTPPSEITPPQSAHPSTSALSSRRNSLDADAMAAQARLQRIPHSGSHYSHTSDADLPTSSYVVVRPALNELKGLQVHVHGIPYTGAKSRVETQIRLRLELVRPADPQQGGEASAASATGFERIGAFNHVKLPPLTGTKRRSKKHKQVDVDAERTLFMDAAVVRATPPHERVFVCRSCQQREKKRAQRRKSGGGGKKEECTDEEQQFTLDDYQELGVNPDAPDAREQALKRTEEEDEKRVVVFNCGDFVAFEDGACVLPTRITCYCRHHREKAGFCLIFTMRDFRGNLVATGSTPPIMITDDHKSVAAAAAASASGMSTMRRVDGVRSRAASTEASEEAPPPVKTETTRKPRKTQRSKPYGDAEERSARRSNAGLNMTPHTSTGQNTPAVINSPSASQSDMSQPDFWNAFAAMANVSGASPPTSSRASTGAQTPHLESTSPLASVRPLAGLPVPSQAIHIPQAQQPNSMHDWVASIASQGSISGQTLNVGPQSLPGFDLQAFIESLQRGQREGNQTSVQQLMMLARSLPGMSLDSNASGSSIASSLTQPQSSAPLPSISKLIPGEGPTSGGIEVTVLGENFVDGLTCYFGDVPASSTRVWGSNTLLCVLPPSASPGPVAVTVKVAGQNDHSVAERFNHSLQLFTYVDATDRALMELALQVVGLQMTGQMQSARDVAMRVVGSGPNQNMTRAHGSGNGGSGIQRSQDAASLSQSRNAVAGLFANTTGNMSFQDSVIAFLRTMDVDLLDQDAASQRWRANAVRLANKQGHTLLHLAAVLGFHRLTLALIQRGAPVNARDHNGMTALHFASLYGRVTVARTLLSHGAWPSVLCEAGRDALDIARANEQTDVEDLLEKITGQETRGDDGDADEDELRAGVKLAQIDDDNLSSIADEESDASSEDECSDDDDRQLLRGHHPVLDAAITVAAEESKCVTPSCDVKAKEATSVMEKDPTTLSDSADERKAGLKSLVFGGFDFTHRPRFGVPNALHGGLPHFHVPVVSVFQMALPPSFVNWSALALSSSPSKDESEEAGASTPTPSSWRDFLEESALWINPLSAPQSPPSYDSLDVPPNGASRFPAIARSEVIKNEEPVAATIAATPTTDTDASRPAQVSRAKPAKTDGEKAARRTLVRSPSLKDDRMLVYFWLPILVSVVMLLCFAKPTSVLSFGDLMSFMPF